MSPLILRVVAGLGANASGQAVTIVIQLLSLPAFLSKWNAETYGTWLIISALPAYLSMADVGVVTATGNRMTMAMGGNDPKRANVIFHSSVLFLIMVCSLLALIIFPLILWAPASQLAGPDGRGAIAALAVVVFVSLFCGLLDAQFRATNRYATGIMLANVVRLIEWGGGIAGLLAAGTFTAVAIGMLGGRAIGFLGLFVIARQGNHRLHWGIRSASRHEITATMRPAIAFMAFPVADAISFQGVTLMVGYLLGPAMVAIFNTYRTLARVSVQATSIFSHTLWPEFSRLFGNGNVASLITLYKRSALVCQIAALSLSAVLYVLSPWLLRVWTHDAIEFIPSLMALLLIYAAVGGLWHLPRVLLLSINKHVRLTRWVLISAIVAVVLSLACGTTLGLNGIGIAMIVSESIVAIACIRSVTQLFRDMSKKK